MVNTDSCLKNTYGYFFIAIIILIIGIYIATKLKLPYLNGIWSYLIIFIIILVLLFWMMKLSPGIPKYIIAIILLLLLGYFLAPIIIELTQAEIWKFALLTLLFVGLLTIVAFIAPKDYFLSWGKILFILLILIFIIGIIALFIFPKRNFIIFYFLLVLAIFGGFVLFDTQLIIQTCQTLSKTNISPDYINLATGLFLDALNIFVATTGLGTT